MDAEGFRIFLASPSGLDDYRRAAREQFEHVRLTIASSRGINFDPLGWEDVSPGFGRPQSVINPKLDECNVMIGILGKQLGTPTGAAESGFVEEYERMAARAHAGEDVAIWIYTVELTADDRDDPGDKLKAMIAFRERLYKEALIKEFRNVDDFARQLYRDLVSLVLGAEEERQQRSEVVAVPSPEEAQAPNQEPSDDAGRQLQELLRQAAEDAPLLPERFRNDRFPLMRLALWLSTWEGWYVTNETFGVHQVNRLYSLGAHAVLSSPERRHLLRSVCAHRPAAPGWALLGYDAEQAAPELLMLAVNDPENAVRAGAFEMLDGDPIDAWLAREDVTLNREQVFNQLCDRLDDLNDVARDAMLDFVIRCGGREALAFLDGLVGRDALRRQALLALIRAHGVAGSSRVFELAAHADIDIDDRTLMVVRAAADEADVGILEELAGGLDERLRIIAVQLLARRGMRAVPALVKRVDDSADGVATAALRALGEVGDPGIDLEAAYSRLAERDGLKYSDDLRIAMDRTRATSALRDSLNWVDFATSSAYRVLAEERWDEFRDVVRRDLGDGFNTFAEESRARYAEQFGVEAMEAITTGNKAIFTASAGEIKPIDSEEVKRIRDFLRGSDLNNRRFAAAGLAGVATNGEAEDAALARLWLDSHHSELREASAQALARVGTGEDVSKLLELSQRHGHEIFASAALSLSPGLSGAALAILDSSRPALALLAARHIYPYASDLSEEMLIALLHHTSEQVRQVGVACALVGYDDDELEQLLGRYTSAERYYYNVAFWLDRVLFAPAYLRERTRAEITEFAEGRRPFALPAGSSRGVRYMARKYVRRGGST